MRGGPSRQTARKPGAGSRAAAVALLVATLLASRAGAQETERLAVIVHPSRNEQLTEADLRRIYLRQRRTWSDGSPIVPVNPEPRSPLREPFRRAILRLDPERLEAYWNERYFDGVFPPITLSSGTAIRRYVASHPNAIGYVRADEAGGDVRVARTID
jgi:hypothetical protein